LDNVFLLCRDCHDWYDGKAHDSDFNKSDEFIRRILPKETYDRLRTMLMHPQPVPDLGAVERYLKQAIQRYS